MADNYVSVLTGTQIDTALQFALNMIYDDVKVYHITESGWSDSDPASQKYGKFRYNIPEANSSNPVVKFKDSNNLVYDMTIVGSSVYSNKKLEGNIIVNTFIPVDQSSN